MERSFFNEILVSKETEQFMEKQTLEQIINLLDVIVWPLTVLIGLLFFRKHIGKVIGSLVSIKAGAQGFEINFIEEQLQEATKQIGIGSFESQSKSGGGINIKGSQAETPYEQLLEVRDALNNKIISKATKENIPTEDVTALALCDELLEINIISRQNARNFNTLLKLTNIAGGSAITQIQVNQIKALYNNLKL